MEVISNNNEVIRSTTLWTLSKFTEWIIGQSDQTIEEYLSMLCSRMIDSDSNVQEAACHAFTVLVESFELPVKLLPLLPQPLNTFSVVIDIYKGNTLGALLDAIGQMAMQLKEYLKQPSAENIR
jgi:hypothetical protein